MGAQKNPPPPPTTCIEHGSSLLYLVPTQVKSLTLVFFRIYSQYSSVLFEAVFFFYMQFLNFGLTFSVRYDFGVFPARFTCTDDVVSDLHAVDEW